MSTIGISIRRALAQRVAAARPVVSSRALAFGVVLFLYATVTVLVVWPSSPLAALDLRVVNLHLRAHHPGWARWVFKYEWLGQRAPSIVLTLPYFLWIAWRRRSTKPLVALATALLALNVSVAVVKYGIGRIGPFYSSNPHNVFAGGDIFPSGHVSNSVVLYGVIALVAVRYRRLLAAGAVFISLTVGLGTLYLRTHWLSDVIGGLLAGSLVLLALPTLVAPVQRATDCLTAKLAARWRVPLTQRGVRVPEPIASAAQQPAPGTSPAPRL